MRKDFLEKLTDKSITPKILKKKVKKNNNLLSDILNGVHSPKAAIRYGCAKVLIELSEENPRILYPHMDFFVDLLDSKYRILTWNAMAVIANLTKVDTKKKFDKIIDKYYQFLHDDFLVTVANLVSYSGKIACAKPYLIPRITQELLKVEQIKTGPHMSEECKKVVAEKVIESLDMFFDQITNRKEIVLFIQRQCLSDRKSLQKKAENFLRRYSL